MLVQECDLSQNMGADTASNGPIPGFHVGGDTELGSVHSINNKNYNYFKDNLNQAQVST